MAFEVRYCRMPDGKLIDLSPMAEGKGVLILSDTGWIPYDGTLGSIFDAKPLTEKETEELENKGVIKR